MDLKLKQVSKFLYLSKFLVILFLLLFGCKFRSNLNASSFLETGNRSSFVLGGSKLCADLSKYLAAESPDHMQIREELASASKSHRAEYTRSLICMKNKADALMKHFRMFPEEAAILANYSGLLYQNLNRALIDGNCEAFTHVTKTLASAITKLPGYYGTLFRGVNMTDSELEALLNSAGKDMITPTFFSTSADFSVANNFSSGKANPVIFEIKEGNGGIVGRFTQYPDEHEVLLNPGTIFHVHKVEKRDRVTWIEVTQETKTPHRTFTNKMK